MHLSTKCPQCGGELWLMSTINEWSLYCKPCDTRYNNALEPKPKEPHPSTHDPS